MAKHVKLPIDELRARVHALLAQHEAIEDEMQARLDKLAERIDEANARVSARHRQRVEAILAGVDIEPPPTEAEHKAAELVKAQLGEQGRRVARAHFQPLSAAKVR